MPTRRDDLREPPDRGVEEEGQPEILRLDAQQLCGIVTEYRRALGVAQARRVEDVVDRLVLPRDRMIGAHHDLAGADLRREVAQRLGIDCSRFPGPIIPVIYNVNLRNPDGYFLATKFQMRNKDVIYIANATSVEISKALNFFRLTVATVNDPIVARPTPTT